MPAATYPTIGEPAPAFSLPAGGGHIISLADFAGKQAVVLYFYPKDDTPGCTKEACAFRDLGAEFAARHAAILGVSADDLDSHGAFAAKYSLGFPLLSDEGAAVARAYGAYGTKNLYGHISEGVLRVTFVIDAQGILRKVYPKVSVEEHAAEVLAFLDTLR